MPIVPTAILTAAQMQTCDRHIIEVENIPSRILMERAAGAVIRYLTEHTESFPVGRVVFLCGSGNNGGDGLAAARLLGACSAYEPVVLYTGAWTDGGTPDETRMSVECARQYRLAVDSHVEILPPDELKAALATAVSVVDAVFGIGLTRPVEGTVATVLKTVAATNLPVLAVDIPSGVDADSGRVCGVALPASATVTMQALKAGLLLYPGAELCGDICVADIGISLAPVSKSFAHLADASLLARVLPPRTRRSNKGTYGRVASVCGSVGMSGAAVLCARGALRAGAGLVEAVTPTDNRPILQISLPEAIVTAYEPDISTTKMADLRAIVRGAVMRADSVVLGCGLGQSRVAEAVLRVVLETRMGHQAPIVLDADALNLIAADDSLWETAALSSPDRQVVLTPHPGEMARLCGCLVEDILSDIPGRAQAYARAHGVTVVLKDAHTVIASPDGTCFVVAAGNAGMATGGSGDVLAGVIASLLAQNRECLTAGTVTLTEVAAAGAYLHAAAGDLAVRAVGEHGLLPSDIIEHIPLVTKGFSDTRTKITACEEGV